MISSMISRLSFAHLKDFRDIDSGPLHVSPEPLGDQVVAGQESQEQRREGDVEILPKVAVDLRRAASKRCSSGEYSTSDETSGGIISSPRN